MNKPALSTLSIAVIFFTFSTSAIAKNAKTIVVDKTFNTAGAMLAYTEFELSGEPLAEALGLDLDSLDPNAINHPTAFDYTAGIENYEYSEEAMYALNFQSRMGAHIVNGPLNAQRGGTHKDLAKRFESLALSVGVPASDIPTNLYPISLAFSSADPSYNSRLDTTITNTQTIDLNGKETITLKPAYLTDFSSLALSEKNMSNIFTPASAGGQMLKDVLWTQDFLGGMHVKATDEETEAESSTQDQDGEYALGVSGADGLNGVLLAELTWDKLLTIKDSHGFDGTNLGTPITANYNPDLEKVWLPAEISVTTKMVNNVKAIGNLHVKDSTSTLRNTWQLLWPLAEFYAMTDQRDANKNQNPAFLAAYDNSPFPAAPNQNTDLDPENDIDSNDPFSLASVLTNFEFKNLLALHYNDAAGTLVTNYKEGKQGTRVNAYDSAYAMVALNIFQRSQDALPVGYASADSGEGLNTKRGQKALDIIKAQADFIITKLIAKNGLVYDELILNKGVLENQSLGTQFAVINGLAKAFRSTGDEKYRLAARNIFTNVETYFHNKGFGTYADESAEYTPYTIAAVSAGLRELMTTLTNKEGENLQILTLQHLTNRFERFFRIVVNGNSVGEGAQLAEWPIDTGENIIDIKTIDNDGDNVAVVHAAGMAPLLAAKVRLQR
jgi:hypothetical protein